jgi:hypothetical protein
MLSRFAEQVWDNNVLGQKASLSPLLSQAIDLDKHLEFMSTLSVWYITYGIPDKPAVK